MAGLCVVSVVFRLNERPLKMPEVAQSWRSPPRSGSSWSSPVRVLREHQHVDHTTSKGCISNRFGQYGIKVSFWGSGTLKIVILVKNHPQRTFRFAYYHPSEGMGY